MRRAHPAVPAIPLPRRLAALLLIFLAALALPAVGEVAEGPATGTAEAVAIPARHLSGVAVEGTDRAVIRLPEAVAGAEVSRQAGAALSSYVNTGYRLRLGDGSTAGVGTAVVEVDLGPVESAAPFQLPALEEGSEPSEIVALAREVTAKSATLYGAVSSVLGWVVHNVVTDETAALAPASAGGEGESEPPSPETGKTADSGGSREAEREREVAGALKVNGAQEAKGSHEEKRSQQAEESQEPTAVLARGSGDDAGIARLTVELLRAVGIEARTVRGRVVGTPEPGGPWGPHTWVEVRYPDAGWVFSDPLHHHHYVPATYLRLPPLPAEPVAEGSTAEEPTAEEKPRKGGQAGAGATVALAESAAPDEGAGSPYRLVERRDDRQTVDLYPMGGPGVTARRNRAVQRAGALRVVVAGPRRGSAVLEGEGGRTSKILVDGESVFVGLPTGEYRLEVYLEDEAPIVRQLELGPRERRAIYLRGPGGETEAAERKPGGSGGRDLPPPDHYRARQPTASRNSP